MIVKNYNVNFFLNVVRENSVGRLRRKICDGLVVRRRRKEGSKWKRGGFKSSCI